MYRILLEAHSGWRYLVLLALVIALVKFLAGWLGGQRWTDLDRRIGAYSSIIVDIQLLLGLILLAWDASLGLLGANPARTIEHPITMIVAIAVMHVGWNRAKKTDEAGRFRVAALTFLATALLIIAGLSRVGGVF